MQEDGDATGSGGGGGGGGAADWRAWWEERARDNDAADVPDTRLPPWRMLLACQRAEQAQAWTTGESEWETGRHELTQLLDGETGDATATYWWRVAVMAAMFNASGQSMAVVAKEQLGAAVEVVLTSPQLLPRMLPLLRVFEATRCCRPVFWNWVLHVAERCLGGDGGGDDGRGGGGDEETAAAGETFTKLVQCVAALLPALYARAARTQEVELDRHSHQRLDALLLCGAKAWTNGVCADKKVARAALSALARAIPQADTPCLDALLLAAPGRTEEVGLYLHTTNEIDVLRRDVLCDTPCLSVLCNVLLAEGSGDDGAAIGPNDDITDSSFRTELDWCALLWRCIHSRSNEDRAVEQEAVDMLADWANDPTLQPKTVSVGVACRLLADRLERATAIAMRLINEVGDKSTALLPAKESAEVVKRDVVEMWCRVLGTGVAGSRLSLSQWSELDIAVLGALDGSTHKGGGSLQLLLTMPISAAQKSRLLDSVAAAKRTSIARRIDELCENILGLRNDTLSDDEETQDTKAEDKVREGEENWGDGGQGRARAI